MTPADAFVCARCQGELHGASGRFECADCGARWPADDGLPSFGPHRLSAQHESQRTYFDAEFSPRPPVYRPENWQRSYVSRIFASLDVPGSGKAYLDVGVGSPGTTVIEAARLGIEAFGCDLSTRAIHACRVFAESEGVSERAHFVVSAAEALPFRDEAFGAVSAVALLEHIEDDRLAATELARVLRPGGRVWVTVPNAFRYLPPPLWPSMWLHDRRLGHLRHYTESTLRLLFDAVGLEHQRTLYSGHLVKIVQFLASRVQPSLRRPESRWWWRLEALDSRAERRAWGALQLSAVFRKRY